MPTAVEADDHGTIFHNKEHVSRRFGRRAPRPHPHSVEVPLEGSIAAKARLAPHVESLDSARVIPPPGLVSMVAPRSTSRIERKIGLIRRSGLFGADTAGAKISRAVTMEDLQAAYRLVHRIYLGKGYISEQEAEMRLRVFETSPDTATFIAKKDGRVVGVLSIVRDSKEFGLPSDEPFAGELKALRKPGLKLGEVTNQVVDEEFRSTAVPTELMRCALAHGIQVGFDLGIAAVSPSHTGFYELLGFRQIGGERHYTDKLHDPVVPVTIDLAQHRDHTRQLHGVEQFMHTFLTAENPYLVYVEAWDNVARDRFRDPELLHRLFVKERNFLKECSDAELSAVRRHWGLPVAHAVAGWLFDHRLGPVESRIACGRSALGAPKFGRKMIGRANAPAHSMSAVALPFVQGIRRSAKRGT